MTKEELNICLKWWESKRLWYNVIVGGIGLIGLCRYSTYFGLIEFIGLLVYGFVANVFYSLGILIELLDYYYFKNGLKIYNKRYILFILGCLFSCIITWHQINIYYNPFFLI
ncbi:MAG: hypothetical protein CMO82_10335 [Winogradskyella sp.]|nr:hypothetical protein [Winogradskyella sp.]